MNAVIGSSQIAIPRNGALGFNATRQLVAYDVRPPLTSYVEDSICEPEIGSAEWAREWVIEESNVAAVARHTDGTWIINPSLVTGEYHQRLFEGVGTPGCTAVTLRLVARRYAPTNNEVRLTLTDFGGNNPVSDTFTIGPNWTVCEVTKSVSPFAVVWAFVQCNNATVGDIGSNRFYVQSVKMIPTASSGMFTSPFIRLGLASLSCNAEAGVTSNTRVPFQSAFAFKRFRTDAAAAAAEYVATNQLVYPSQSHLALIGENAEYSLLPQSAFPQMWNMNGLPGTLQRYDIISGATVKNAGTIIGTFLRALYLPKNCTWSIGAVAPDWVAYGDSITAGFGADVAPLEGYAALLRKSVGGRLAVEAYGNRKLSEDAATPELRTAFVQKLLTHGAHNYVFLIGTNDYGFSTMTVAAFGTAYGALLDALKAADPAAAVWCVTPLNRTTETGNLNGETLTQFRVAIANAVATRTNFCKLISGPDLMDVSLVGNGGVHPTTAGHAAVASALAPLLGI